MEQWIQQNYKRIHSAIGYMTPAQKMAELEKVA
jgi:transposase InsO family protein